MGHSEPQQSGKSHCKMHIFSEKDFLVSAVSDREISAELGNKTVNEDVPGTSSSEMNGEENQKPIFVSCKRYAVIRKQGRGRNLLPVGKGEDLSFQLTLQKKQNTHHKTLSSRKLATLLLRIDTAICRVGDMHS